MALPTEADQIVVQGFLLDERTGRGDTTATVTSTPVPLTGQDPLRPLLLDAQSHAHIRTAERVTVPEPTDGYWAVLAVSNTDPDLTAYGGRRFTMPGLPVTIIEVPHNAPYVTVSAAMALQVNKGLAVPLLTVGQQVRALWFHQAATSTPAPVPPSSFWSAAQTMDAIDAGLDAHDTDPQAHPDIRALIAQGGGGGGGPRSAHHEQVTAAATWTVTHSLGFNPAGIVARDSVGLIEPADVTYPSVNTVVLTWSVPVAGSVDLS